MSKLRIKTRREFLEALRSVPFAAARLPEQEYRLTHDGDLSDYGLWHTLTDFVNEAIAGSDWAALPGLLSLYDAVERVGPRSEMYDASYVAFLEDVRLPTEPARLRQLWRSAPRAFTAAIQHDRGLR